MKTFTWFERQQAVIDIFDEEESGIEDDFGTGLELSWNRVERRAQLESVCLNACEPGWKLDGGGGLGEGAEISEANTSSAQRKRTTEDSEWHGLLHLQDDEALDALDLR